MDEAELKAHLARVARAMDKAIRLANLQRSQGVKPHAKKDWASDRYALTEEVQRLRDRITTLEMQVNRRAKYIPAWPEVEVHERVERTNFTSPGVINRDQPMKAMRELQTGVELRIRVTGTDAAAHEQLKRCVEVFLKYVTAKGQPA